MARKKTSQADEFFHVGLGYLENREWDSAVQYFRSVLESDPDHTQAQFRLGEALVAGGELEEGIAKLRACFDKQLPGARSALLDALVARSRQANLDGDNDLALDYCEQALEISPSYGPAFQLKISIWMRRGDNALLRDNFLEAAEAYGKAGDTNRARQIEKLHRWQSEADLEAHARSLELAEKWEAAAALYGQLIESTPDVEIKESWKLALVRCQEEQQLAEIYAQGLSAFKNQQWEPAGQALLKLVNQRPEYRRDGEWAVELLSQAIRAQSSRFIPSLPTSSPIKGSPAAISDRNAHRVVRLARWGSGTAGPVAYASAGPYLAIAASIGIYIYDAQSLVRSAFIDTDDRVISVALSSDGEIIACGMSDGVIWVWNTEDGSLIRKLRGHAKAISVLAFSRDGTQLASGSEDGSVRIWQNSDGKMLRLLEGRLPAIQDLSFAPDGARLALAAADDQVRIRHVAASDEDHTLRGHSGAVRQVAYSPDGRLLASAADDGEVKIWDALSRQMREVLRGHHGVIQGLHYSPDGADLAVGMWNGAVVIWDVESGEIKNRIDQGNHLLTNLAYSPDGTALATSTMDNRVRIWRMRDAVRIFTFDEFSGRINDISFAADGQTVAAGYEDGLIDLWDVARGERRHSIKGHLNPIQRIAFSPGGQYLAASGQDEVVRIWQQETLLYNISSPSGPLQALAFSIDENLIAAGTQGGMIHAWNLADGNAVMRLQAHDAPIRQLAYSPGGTLMASAGEDGSLKVWLASNGNQIETFEGFSRKIMTLAFSPAGKELICGTAEGEIWLWYTTTNWNLANKFKAFDQRIETMAASPVSSILATGDPQGRILLWDLSRRGRAEDLLLGTLPGHRGEVTALHFSPDGSLLASSGSDGVIRVWGVVAG